MRVSSWLKRPWLWVCTIVLVLGVAAFALSDSVRYVVIMTIASVTYGITTARDVDKAAALQQAVVSKTTAIHRFVRDSKNYPGRPPISVNPGVTGNFHSPARDYCARHQGPSRAG